MSAMTGEDIKNIKTVVSIETILNIYFFLTNLSLCFIYYIKRVSKGQGKNDPVYYVPFFWFGDCCR